MKDKVLLRDATLDDVPFIARVVLAGIDMVDLEEPIVEEQQPILDHLVDICQLKDTLYSYLHTRMATLEGRVVGALIGYDGGRYAEMRAKTFGLVLQNSGLDLSKNAMETGKDEFYLDSMAIIPEYRGRGIGLQLIRDRMNWAIQRDFKAITLLVDKNKPKLQRYYESLGFEFGEEIFVFGAWYRKLVYSASHVDEQ